jgi:hypothetical protein
MCPGQNTICGRFTFEIRGIRLEEGRLSFYIKGTTFFFKETENFFQSLILQIYTFPTGLSSVFFNIFEKFFIGKTGPNLKHRQPPADVPFHGPKNRKEPWNIIRYWEYGQFIDRISDTQDIQYQPAHIEEAGARR